jgi:Tetratricopeptide repeat
MTTAFADSDLLVRKGLGRARLNSQRIEEAVGIYAAVLRDCPEDVDAHLVLGDLYLAGGDAATASKLYSHAQSLDPQNADIFSRVALAQAEHSAAPDEPAEPVPTNPSAIARLLQRLTGRANPVTEAEVNRASSMLQEIVHSRQPALAVAERLHDIDTLLPALLELNIRQARADGRLDLAEALRLLLQNIRLQLVNRVPKEDDVPAEAVYSPTTRLSVLFLAAGDSPARPRFKLAAEALQAAGCQPSVAPSVSPALLRKLDCLVASLADGAQAVEATCRAFVAVGKQVVIDVPSEASLGAALDGGEAPAVLRLANRLTAPSAALVEALRTAGYDAALIPPGWSRQSQVWDSTPPDRPAVSLGWLGTPGCLEDGIQIRRTLVRLLREFPGVNLVVAGEPEMQRLFDDLPEAQRRYLPPISPEEIFSAAGEVDILLAPLHPTDSNRLQSDLPLLAAGVRGIPWVASPIPAYVEWKAGGLIAASPEMWHSHLHRLITSAAERRRLGEAGRQKAEEREVNNLDDTWLKAVGAAG